MPRNTALLTLELSCCQQYCLEPTKNEGCSTNSVDVMNSFGQMISSCMNNTRRQNGRSDTNSELTEIALQNTVALADDTPPVTQEKHTKGPTVRATIQP